MKPSQAPARASGVMRSLLTALPSVMLALAALASPGAAGELVTMRVLIEGPVPGGELSFGLYNDYLQLEGCGGTCFAPAVFSEDVPCASTDSPEQVAAAIASAVNADPLAQAAGYFAVASSAAVGVGELTLTGPGNDDYQYCLDQLWHLNGAGLGSGSSCCMTYTTPCGVFRCVTIEVEPDLGTSFCPGTSCPCGNDDPTAGCFDSTGNGGTLRPAPGSSTSLATDGFRLDATHAPGNSGLLLLSSVGDVPLTSFDGRNCVRGGPRALPGADVGGMQPFGDVDLVAQDGVRNLGSTLPGQGLFGLVDATFPGFVSAGSSISAQFWFRDVLCGPPPTPCPSPCDLNANFSNGWTFTVTP